MVVAKVRSRIDKNVLLVPLRRDLFSWVRAACTALRACMGLWRGLLIWADGESHESRSIGGAQNRVWLTQCKRSRKSLSHKTRLAAMRKRTLDAGRGRQWKRVQRAAATCEGPRRHYLLAFHRAEAEDLARWVRNLTRAGVHGPSDQVPSLESPQASCKPATCRAHQPALTPDVRSAGWSSRYSTRGPCAIRRLYVTR